MCGHNCGRPALIRGRLPAGKIQTKAPGAGEGVAGRRDGWGHAWPSWVHTGVHVWDGSIPLRCRRNLVLNEADAIGTAYLRAELLPEPHRTEIRNLLREYVNVRLEGVQPGKLEQAIHRSEELHGRLWSQAVAAVEKNPGFSIAGLFIWSLNEVIDLHSKRVEAGLRRRIPGIIWAALYFITILAMAAMGYYAGLTGTRGSLAILAVVLTFSAVIMLIADLDRPQEGLLKVSQQAMADLRNTMIAPGP